MLDTVETIASMIPYIEEDDLKIGLVNCELEKFADKSFYIQLLVEKLTKDLDYFSDLYGHTIYSGSNLFKPISKDKAVYNIRFTINYCERLISGQMNNKPEEIKIEFKLDSLPDFLTDDDLSKILSFTKSTLSTYRSKGKLPKRNNIGLTSKSELIKHLEGLNEGKEKHITKLVDQKLKSRKK